MSNNYINMQNSELQSVIMNAEILLKKQHSVVFGDDEIKALSMITGENIVAGKTIAAAPKEDSCFQNTIQVTQLIKIKNEKPIIQLVILVNDKGVLDVSFNEDGQPEVELFDYDKDWYTDLLILVNFAN